MRDQSNNQTEEIRNRVLGCMVGGAVGDALGYPVEFWNIGSIQNRFGERGISRYLLSDNGKALILDDTQMSLFTANGLLLGMTRGCTRGIMGRLDTYCTHSYADWYRTQTSSFRNQDERTDSWLLDVPELFSRRAPGTTCLESIRAIMDYRKPNNDSCGCGGVMRTAPVALLCHVHKYASGNRPVVDMVAAETARLTHKHPLGFMPSAVLNHLLMDIMDGDVFGRERLAACAENAIRILPDIESEDDGGKTYGTLWPTHVKCLQDIIRQAIDLANSDTPDIQAIGKIGEGWTGHEALAIALYSAVKHAESFEDAVVSAVNHSGDSDSTGAICGNIMGCLLGRDRIPECYTRDLELIDVIEEMAADLYTGCIIHEYDDIDTPEKRRWFEKYVDMRWNKQ